MSNIYESSYSPASTGPLLTSGGSVFDSPQVSTDSVKSLCNIENIEITNAAATELAEDVTFRIRRLLQNAQPFMSHSKRSKLMSEDIDFALRTEGLAPVNGVVASEHIPFRFSPGGGRQIGTGNENEVELNEFISAPLPKIPQTVALRPHWLAIDGVVPATPENCPALNKNQLKKESVDPLSKLKNTDAKNNKIGSLQVSQKTNKLPAADMANVKQLAKQELSVEQQLYYREITEACVGSDESRRAEALLSLASDSGLHQMLPRLCTFIAEGVRVNVVQHNLAILIYLMRMVKSLLENQTLFLEKYLHELIPAVTTCIVAKQLCTRPEVDNHWALRDFASRLMSNICKNFNTSTNNIQTRITRMFSEGLKSETVPLVSQYGSIAGLQELGSEVIKTFIIPNIKIISFRLDNMSDSQADKLASNHIRNLIMKSVSPVLKNVRDPPDVVEDYKKDFGSLGIYLHAVVQRTRPAKSAQVSQTRLSTDSSTNI